VSQGDGGEFGEYASHDIDADWEVEDCNESHPGVFWCNVAVSDFVERLVG